MKFNAKKNRNRVAEKREKERKLIYKIQSQKREIEKQKIEKKRE
jgi:hypothetical protein